MEPVTIDTRPPPAGASREVTIGAAAALGLVGSVGAAALGVVRSKITAVVLGPAGIGLTSEILQITTLFNAPAAMFTGPAFVAAVAKARSQGDDGKVARLYYGAFSGALILSVVGGVGAIAAGRVLLPAPWGRTAWPLAALSVIGALFASLASVPAQMMVGHGLLRVLAVATLLSAVVQTAVVAAGTLSFGLTGQFAALAVGPAASLAITLALGSRANPELRWRPRWAFDGAFALDAVKLGGTALASAIGTQAALVVVRWALERAGGPELNGQFQAAWTIANVYFGLVLTALANYSFPRYAAARGDAELQHEVSTAAAFVMRAAPPLVLLVIAFRHVLIRKLYTSQFDLAIGLLGLMMVGDLAKAVVWVQHGVLLARSRLRAYLVVEMTGIALLAVGALLLVPRVGLAGVGYAYAGAYVVLVPVSTAALRVTTGTSVSSRTLMTAAAATALLGVAAWYTAHSTVGPWVTAAVATGWLFAAGLVRDGFRTARATAARWASAPSRPPS